MQENERLKDHVLLCDDESFHNNHMVTTPS